MLAVEAMSRDQTANTAHGSRDISVDPEEEVVMRVQSEDAVIEDG